MAPAFSSRSTPLWLLAVVLALFLGSRSGAKAQANFTFSSTTSNVSLTLAVSDYNLVSGVAQITSLSGNSFLIKSNKKWELSVRAQSSTFAFTPSNGDANPGKSCSDLAVREGGSGDPWIPITTSNILFTADKQGNYTVPSKQIDVDYRLSSSLKNDPPGTYSLTLIWTLTQP